MVLYERIIEVDIVGYKYFVLQQLIYLCRDLFERWGIGHHIIIYACKPLYKVRDGYTGVYKALVVIEHFIAVVYDDGNFGNAVCGGKTPCCFNIYYGIQHQYNFAN